MPISLVKTVFCSSCTRPISTEEVAIYGLGNEADGYQCLDCRKRLAEAQMAAANELSVILTERPVAETRCSKCKRTYAEIELTDKTQSIFFHFIDGAQIGMCPKCSDELQRRSKIYKGETAARGDNLDGISGVFRRISARVKERF